MRRRVWCETLSFEELLAPPVVALLVRHRLELLLAVRPWHVAQLAEVHARLAGAGVHVALWPMLDDARGRWASVGSHGAFVQLADELLAAAPAAPELVIDLEPAFADLEKWKSWRPRWGKGERKEKGREKEEIGATGTGSGSGTGTGSGSGTGSATATATATGSATGTGTGTGSGSGTGSATASTPTRAAAFATASSALSAAIARWQAPEEGPARRVTTAVLPLLVFDTAGQLMQRALGTPADELPVQCHSVMAYTSLFEGWSRGLIGRRRAEWMLGLCARAARTRWGTRAGISLGAVGTGAFGDEPVLRSPAELARDVAIARAAGLTEISLFDLGGVVRRQPAEAWLEALGS